jgi:hypothetical protein
MQSQKVSSKNGNVASNVANKHDVFAQKTGMSYPWIDTQSTFSAYQKSGNLHHKSAHWGPNCHCGSSQIPQGGGDAAFSPQPNGKLHLCDHHGSKSVMMIYGF